MPAPAPASQAQARRLALLLDAALLEVHWDGHRNFHPVFVSQRAAWLLGLGTGPMIMEVRRAWRRLAPCDRLRLLRAFLRAHRAGTDVDVRLTSNCCKSPGGLSMVASLAAAGGGRTWLCVLRTPAAPAAALPVEVMTAVMHEMRTPLHAVLGFTQLLRHRLSPAEPSVEEREQYLRFIESSALHLTALLDDLAHSSCEPGGALPLRIESVQLDAVVAEAVATMQPAARAAGVPIAVAGSGPALRVAADAMRLRQVLLNLLSNAIKYSARGAPTCVGWSVDLPSRTARITVLDSGIGLRADQLDRLFKPFDRLGAERTCVKGTGIGLVISRALIRLMGGDIEVRSDGASGSSFVVVVPIAGDSP